MDENTRVYPVKFPNAKDGTTMVNERELQFLIAKGEVTIKAQHIPSTFFPVLAELYLPTTDEPSSEG